MTEKYATTCPHCQQPLYITLTISDEEGQKPPIPSKEPATPLSADELETTLRHELDDVLEFVPGEGVLYIRIKEYLKDAHWSRVNKLARMARGKYIKGGDKPGYWEVPT
jgi:hypothetical protein